MENSNLPNTTDKRKLPRSNVDCEMVFFHPGSSNEERAQVTNISVSGLSFTTKSKLTEGAALHITINTIIPPLNALIEINRIENGDEDEFHVAATIEGIKAC